MLLEKKEGGHWTWEQQAMERHDGNKDEETAMVKILRDLIGRG